MRNYNKLIPPEEIGMWVDLMTIQEWEEALEEGMFTTYDGTGYWVKDGKESDDEVFSTKQEDATHVAWYNK